jgi:hypothetical protein
MSILTLALLGGCTEYEVVLHDGTDVFYQDPPSAVDILLIVDDSCSMGPYQKELSKNFSEFISFFTDANIQYQIGVVTTDIYGDDAGRLINSQYITPETPDGEAQFADMVSVGTGGSGNEMGLEAARLALTEPRIGTSNAGFLRDEASLSLIFVSDEEDASPLPTYEYIRTFQDVKGARSRDVFNASALVVDEVASCSLASQAGSTRGDRYIDVAGQTSGVIGDICAESFADIVTDLSLNASRLMDTFFLSGEPQPSTLQVSVDDVLYACDEGAWSFDRVEDDQGVERPAVVFERDFIPEPNSQVAIRYNLGSGDPTDFCTGAEE